MLYNNRSVNPAQAKRLRELPQLIAKEQDPERANQLADELRDLATLELEEMRSKFLKRCPACGFELGVHTDEMLEQCARKQQRED